MKNWPGNLVNQKREIFWTNDNFIYCISCLVHQPWHLSAPAAAAQALQQASTWHLVPQLQLQATLWRPHLDTLIIAACSHTFLHFMPIPVPWAATLMDRLASHLFLIQVMHLMIQTLAWHHPTPPPLARKVIWKMWRCMVVLKPWLN